MVERKLERDRVRPSHHTFSPGSTRPDVKVGRGHLIVQPPQGGRSRRQPRSCSARSDWRILAGSEQQAWKHACVRGPGCRRWKHPAVPLQRNSNVALEPASSRSRRLPHRRRRDEPLAPMAGERIPNRQVGLRATKKRGRNGAKSPSHARLGGCPKGRIDDGGERTKISYRWEAGAQRARRLRLGSNPEVEGPRRGPKPREGRPEGRWKRRLLVRTHLRSNASKVLHHAVMTRTSMPATVATNRSRPRGKRTSRGQRSWRHDTAADEGNPPEGMNSAAGTRRSRDRLHTDHGDMAGVGCRSHPDDEEKRSEPQDR